jgi:hypothetical protein
MEMMIHIGGFEGISLWKALFSSSLVYLKKLGTYVVLSKNGCRGEHLFAWAFKLNSISSDIMGRLKGQIFQFQVFKGIVSLGKTSKCG